MKKFIFFLNIFLFFIICTNSFARYGAGDLKMSLNSVKAFQRYLSVGKPERFFISIDGENTHWYYCPYPNCAPMGDSQELKKCEKRSGTKCGTFAVGRSVKWNNGMSSKKVRFKSKDSLEEIKEKLTIIGFYESDNREKTKLEVGRKDKNKKNDIDTDLVSQLEQLIKHYKSGALTEKEFKEAKEKLLK